MKKVFNPRVKRVLSFDLNNTLIDQRKSFEHHFIQGISDLTGRWNAEDYELTPEKIWVIYELERKKLITKSKRKRSRQEIRALCLEKALSALPLDVDDALIRSFFIQLDRRMRSDPIFFPYTETVLQQLSERYRIGIISNGGAAELFQSRLTMIPENYIFTAKKCGFRKPHPGIFQHAIKTLGIQAKQAVMIGNSWKADIRGATNFGMDAVWIHQTSIKKRKVLKRGKHRVVIIRKINQLTNIL